MFSSTSLFAALILSMALAAMADPVSPRKAFVKTSLTRHFNPTNTRKALDATRSRNSEQSIDQRLLVYAATIEVGNPPTAHSLILDSGSSNTWIGARTQYTSTDTTIETGETINLRYAGGLLEGSEYLDQVSITDGLVIANQSIGVANTSQSIGSWDSLDGIFGIGPTNLTFGTLLPSSNETVPTVLDNAFAQGLISDKMLGVFFQPTTQLNLTNGGEITWGGVDESKFIGDIVFTNITTTYPSSRFWGLDLEATYGENLTILSGSSGLVDTGNPFLSLGPDAYNAYLEATGAVFDPVVGMPKVNATQAALLQPLYFHINGVPFEMSPNAQSWPKSLNSALYGTSTATQDLDSTFLVIVEYAATTYDFILGYTFLERFYVAFDAENNRVGFAPTRFTKAIIN